MASVPPKTWRWWWLLIPLAYALYFHALGATGLLGPDEPRYASVAREMTQSGDWITPRLWGEPWFEKPALLYWMTAAAFSAGLGADLAPRLPVALLSVGFLLFFRWVLAREFGARAGWFGMLILGTCGGWVGYSAIGVTDIPLAACFSAAMLLALPWLARGDARPLPAAAALLGAAVLAKGLVPLVLVLPLLWMGRRRWRDLLRPRVAAVFLCVALPWYWLCYLRNGRLFLEKFIWEHHFGRFASDALLHGQPWWFYVPVLLAALLPWTLLPALVPRRRWKQDARLRLLAAWVGFGLVFFSASANKLPGYLLPLLPAAAALAAVALDNLGDARLALAGVGLLLISVLVTAQVLPAALAAGLSRAPRPAPSWTWGLPVLVAAGAWRLEALRRRTAAVLLLAGAVAAGVFYIKTATYNEIARAVSARELWRGIAPRRGQVCVAGIHRSWRYGLNYYSQTPLPDCDAAPRPWRITQVAGHPPEVRGPSPGDLPGGP